MNETRTESLETVYRTYSESAGEVSSRSSEKYGVSPELLELVAGAAESNRR